MEERVLKLKNLWFTYAITPENPKSFIFYGNSDKSKLPNTHFIGFSKDFVIDFSSAGVLFISADSEIYYKSPDYVTIGGKLIKQEESNIMTKFIENNVVPIDCISEKTYKKFSFDFSNGNEYVGKKDCIDSSLFTITTLDIKKDYYKSKKTENVFMQKSNVILSIDAEIEKIEEGEKGE